MSVTGVSGAHGNSAAGRRQFTQPSGLHRGIGLALALILTVTPVRASLESSMTTHMLLHIPLLLVAGVLASSPVRARSAANTRLFRQGWNPGGVPGLVVVAAVLTTWMIPRALDLAATDVTVSGFKAATLLLAGVLLRSSWPAAGAIGQAFFVGNLTWMGAVVGLLLRDAPVRVCTTYLERDQVYAGTGLLLLAAAVGVRWFTTWLGATTGVVGTRPTTPALDPDSHAV